MPNIPHEPVAAWSGRGVKRDEHGHPYVGTSRAGVEWYFRAPTFTKVGFRQMCDRFDERECYVERGLTADVWGDGTPYGECPCRECRRLRAES